MLADKYLLLGLKHCAHEKFDVCVFNTHLDDFASVATSLYEMDHDVSAPLRRSFVDQLVESWDGRHVVNSDGVHKLNEENRCLSSVLEQTPVKSTVELLRALGQRMVDKTCPDNGWH